MGVWRLPTSEAEAPDLTFRAERAAVAAALSGFCDMYLADAPGAVGAAIRYSLLGEGKRLRAVLVSAAYSAAGGAGDVSALAAAVEVVHAYSLVHDDLPCMDDDDMRRGRPTTHIVYGVPVATAAGLAMVPLAARTAAAAAVDLGLDDAGVSAVVLELMRAAGGAGMIGGQLLDLEGEGRPLALGDLERIHRLKTGALITASVRLGGLAAGATDDQMLAFTRYGDAIGLAFQIADDVLDVTATTDQLGKTAGRDVALAKSTYPALLGINGAIARAEALVEEAREALQAQALLTPQLDHLARFFVTRQS
jgi:geranylgeranyl pyrophosphate synthase